jgi:hypothetical protein
MRAQDAEAELRTAIAKYRHDPLGFAYFAFPWGQEGTPLANMIGPMQWQAEELVNIGVALATGNRKYRRAVASGKGIGKSALVSMMCLWALCTFPRTKVVLTAGTEPQLRTKTMPELAKWFRMLICKHWFTFTATSVYVNDPEPEAQKEWRLDALPWNANNPEAFQGLHNQGARLIVLFDEASQIADTIFDVTDGIMSDADTEVAWLLYGNPTRGIGKFKEAFDPGSRWSTRAIDSRTVPITDKAELAAQIEENGGEDSDYVRWAIRGLFPRVAETQFISSEDVTKARKNDANAFLSDPLIMGVDVARFGGDKSVIAFRKGRDARSIPWKVFEKLDTMQLANEVVELWRLYKVDAIHVDGGGMGAGVVDRLRQLNCPVVEVQFGGKADRAQVQVQGAKYANKRTEMWGLMREALPTLAVPDSDKLQKELTSALYGYRDKSEEMQLVSKEIMKRVHKVDSPDLADALALTFAYPVQKRADNQGGGQHRTNTQDMGAKALTEYDPFA